MQQNTLSILIPVYNEKKLVEASIRGVYAAQLPTISKKEVIVIDDGSTDGSLDVIKRLKNELGFVLIVSQVNQGKGAALQKGIGQATCDYIVFHDADLEYDPNDFRQMLIPLQSGKADIVYGSRFVGSEMRRLLFFWHEVGNKLITLLINMVTDLNFSDNETCYKMFKREVFDQVKLVKNGFELDIEVTIKAAYRRFRFFEVAIAYNGRTYEEGKKIGWQDGVKALYYIFKFGLLDRFLKQL